MRTPDQHVQDVGRVRILLPCRSKEATPTKTSCAAPKWWLASKVDFPRNSLNLLFTIKLVFPKSIKTDSEPCQGDPNQQGCIGHDLPMTPLVLGALFFLFQTCCLFEQETQKEDNHLENSPTSAPLHGILPRTLELRAIVFVAGLLWPPRHPGKKVKILSCLFSRRNNGCSPSGPAKNGDPHSGNQQRPGQSGKSC